MSASATLPMATEDPPKNLTAKLLGLVGHLTDGKSGPGKLWARFEGASTAAMDRLARSPRFLGFAGKGLQRMFFLRREAREIAEEWLHMWRVPALSDIQAMRTQLRRLEDRLEVTTTQLELALAALERLQSVAEGRGEPEKN